MTQNILITGATSGIGRESALLLARKGHRVFAAGRNRSALTELGEIAEREGLDLEPLRLDINDADEIEAARQRVRTATAGYGLDALVNNAGYGHAGPAAEMSDAQSRAMFETNVFGLMAVTRAFLPDMIRRGAGRVVNVSSIGGELTMPFMGVYTATKHAVEGLSDALRMELAPLGIKVVVVQPGPINTNFSNTSLQTVDDYVDTGSPYDTITRNAAQLVARAESLGSPPIVIARAIERALFARRPRARYVAPFTSWVALSIGRSVPTWLYDGVLRLFFGLRRRNLALPEAAAA